MRSTPSRFGTRSRPRPSVSFVFWRNAPPPPPPPVQAAVRYFLGPSVMVPEVRVHVNATGFRPENLRLLSKDPNKLGLALISHTRLKGAEGQDGREIQAAGQSGRQGCSQRPIEGSIGHKGLRDQLAATIGFLKDEETRCLIEEKVTEDRNRYAYTLLHLWQKDQEFRSAWALGAGTCLHHAPDVLEMAGHSLGVSALGVFVRNIWTCSIGT